MFAKHSLAHQRQKRWLVCSVNENVIWNAGEFGDRSVRLGHV